MPPGPGPQASVGAHGSDNFLLPSGPYTVGFMVGSGIGALGLDKCGMPRGSALLDAAPVP